jgi:hypothetical protein
VDQVEVEVATAVQEVLELQARVITGEIVLLRAMVVVVDEAAQEQVELLVQEALEFSTVNSLVSEELL